MSRREHGATLLAIARGALRQAVAAGAAPALPAFQDEEWLTEHGASFVTLERAGLLRGCIGSLYAWRALAEDVGANARAAALDDPRFQRVTADELPDLELEVSLLTAPEPLVAPDRGTLLDALRPSLDGLILEYRGRKATFLPQVWDNLREPEAFLRELLLKAELRGDFWSDEIAWQRYEVENWRGAVEP